MIFKEKLDLQVFSLREIRFLTYRSWNNILRNCELFCDKGSRCIQRERKNNYAPFMKRF